MCLGLALKEFNVEDIGEFRVGETKRKRSKTRKPKGKRKNDESGEECEQEVIFDYNRIGKMCNVEDQYTEKMKKKKDAERTNTAKKLCTNKKTFRLSKNNDKNIKVDDDNGDDIDIIGNMLTTTRSGRRPKRSRKRFIEDESLCSRKKYANQNLDKKLRDSFQQVVNKPICSVATDKVITLTTLTRSNEIDDQNNESNISSLSADLDESFMNRVNGYNSEDLTASVTRLTGRLEKRMGHLSNLENQIPPQSATANSLCSPLPSFSTLTPGIHNSRALSESMKIIDQLTSDVETACIEMNETQLLEVINEANLNQSGNVTAVAMLNAGSHEFDETNSIINVRNSGDCNGNGNNITIIALEFTEDNNNDDSNNNNSVDNNNGSIISDNNESLIVPHYEVITGDMLGEEVTYFSSDTATNLVISKHCGTGEETYLIVEETTTENVHPDQHKDPSVQQENVQQQVHENTVRNENVTHTEESECILGE